MSHVDEGMLHAYLDGELPVAERTALEAHLAQCEACRARLAEERALVERASALLGAARPIERPAPPFEQLRRGPKRSPWLVRTPVAWAASIALALGLGYVLHDVGAYRMGRVAEAPRAPASPAPAPVAVPERDQLGSASRQVAPSAQSRSYVAERKLEPSQREAPDNHALAQLGRVVDSSALKVAGRSAAAAAPRSDSPPQALYGSAAANGVVVLTEREPAAKTWPRIDRQTAKTILGEDPVGLPDLSTRTFRRSPDRDGVVVVEQELDPRTTIQIFQQSAGARSSVIDSMVTGSYLYHGNERARADRLARFVGNLRVEIGGPVSVDSLNRLLDLVRPLP